MNAPVRHWVHVHCLFCDWFKSFSPESKPVAIRKACSAIAEHFIGHGLHDLHVMDPDNHLDRPITPS